ncbi:unnamed protein product [marine sediment metagenome]|uniref:Uncharacterized protein n=1 Tax=marine sediment metagenome TaxID=412755 RepID=X0VY11_9ZZZZ
MEPGRTGEQAMSDSSQYEAGYAAGWDDARNGRAEPASTVSPYWNGYHDGATDARGHYA